MGIFSRNTGKKAANKSKKPAIRSYAPGRSCLDCKHCDTNRADGDRIYCRWDSEHYYPEAGKDCIDFNK